MTPTSRFRVLISAVSSEFASARAEIATDLRSRGIEVMVQEDFRQEADADTTLQKLHDYVESCSAVIAVIGRRSGTVPPPAAAEPYQPLVPGGLDAPSYTQWEILFARHYGKRLSIHVARPGHRPDRSEPGEADDAALQSRFVDYLFEEQGLDRSPFSTNHELCRRVLREDWPRVREQKPILLPYASLGELFKGRGDSLRDLHRSLQGEGEATAIVGKALHGLGGVGKTRLAVEYGWRHLADYTAIFFLAAETPEILRQSLAGLTDPEVLDLPEHGSAEESARVGGALRWLNEHPGWLLIVDNVDTPEAAQAGEAVLAKVRGGHVLFTSRLSQWGGGVAAMELDVLDPDDAARFLLERTASQRRVTEADDSDAADLARELGGLALALEQAGAYIARRRLSFAGYLELWRSHLPAVQEWHDERIMKYPRSVAVTWETTLAQLDAGAIALLRLLSWFAPEPLPLTVLEAETTHAVWQKAVARVEAEEPTAAPASGVVVDALATLRDFSMAVCEPKETRVASVHRVVQEIIRNRLPDSSRLDWLSASLMMLMGVLPGNPEDVQTWATWNSLRQHAAGLAALADEAGIRHPTSELMGALGALFFTQALYTEAEPLLRRAVELDTDEHGPDDPRVAVHQSHLAQLLRATNRPGEAEPLMRRALEITQSRYGPNHARVAIDLNVLAQLLHDTNRLVEAERLYRRALDIDMGTERVDDPAIATRLNNLAQLLHDTNRQADAEPLMRRALEIYEASFGKNHPHVASALGNLGQLLIDTDQAGKAEPLLRRALQIVETSYEPDHPTIAIHLNNLAALLQLTNRLLEAEPLRRRALEILEGCFGPDHPKIAINLANLAQLLQVTGRLEEAEELMRRALEIDEGSYSPDHPNVALRLKNLAALLKDTNRLEEAEPLSRRCVSILFSHRRRTGHEHPQAVDALAAYHGLLRDLGRGDEEIRTAVLGLMADNSSNDAG